MNIIFGRTALVAILVLAHPLASLAEEQAPSPPADPFASLVRLVASMAIVTGLILAAGLATKKLLARARTAGGQDKLLHIRQTLSVGSKRQIFVLEADGIILIVGAAGDNMRLLTTLPQTPGEGAAGQDDELGFVNALGVAAAHEPESEEATR